MKRRKKRFIILYVLTILLLISVGFNILMFVKLHKNSISLFEVGTIELTKDNYDKYISVKPTARLMGRDIWIQESERGKTTEILHKNIDYRLKVAGNPKDYKYEDVSVVVKIIIKANGRVINNYSDDRMNYLESDTKPYNQAITEEYTFNLLEKGNTENDVHENVEFDNMGFSNDNLFVDYEIVSISGKVIKK